MNAFDAADMIIEALALCGTGALPLAAEGAILLGAAEVQRRLPSIRSRSMDDQEWADTCAASTAVAIALASAKNRRADYAAQTNPLAAGEYEG